MSHAMSLGPIAYDMMRSFHYIVFFALGAGLAKYRSVLAGLVSGLSDAGCVVLLILRLLAISARWTLPFGATAGDLSAGLGSAILILLAISWPAFAVHAVTPMSEWLGRVSYSLYLTHVPVMAFWVYLLHERAGLAVCILIAIPAALAAAHLLAKTVEVPAIIWGRNLTGTSKT